MITQVSYHHPGERIVRIVCHFIPVAMLHLCQRLVSIIPSSLLPRNSSVKLGILRKWIVVSLGPFMWRLSLKDWVVMKRTYYAMEIQQVDYVGYGSERGNCLKTQQFRERHLCMVFQPLEIMLGVGPSQQIFNRGRQGPCGRTAIPKCVTFKWNQSSRAKS